MNVIKASAKLVAVWCAAASFAVWAAADVGLINQLQGDVSYQGGGASAAKAAAFMKVREGDAFSVPAGAVLRIVYFEGGRQETWKGPASFKAGPKAGEAQAGNKPEISQVPGGVPAKLSQTADVIQIAKLGRAGGVTVRGFPPKLTAAQAAEVAQAKKTYESWKSASAADDIAPEMYLYTVLQDHMLYDDMKAVVKTMQDKQPNSQEVQALAAWVNTRQN